MMLPRFCSCLRRPGMKPHVVMRPACGCDKDDKDDESQALRDERCKGLTPKNENKEKFSVRVIFDGETDGEKLIPIGQIRAASNWYGPRAASSDQAYKEKALDNLINAAEDIDADAIVGVEYSVDHVDAGDTPGSARLQRIFATGVAVKIPRP